MQPGRRVHAPCFSGPGGSNGLSADTYNWHINYRGGRNDIGGLTYLAGKEVDPYSGGPLSADQHSFLEVGGAVSTDVGISEGWGYVASGIQAGAWLIPGVGAIVGLTLNIAADINERAVGQHQGAIAGMIIILERH